MHLLAAPEMAYPHPSTVSPPGRPGYRGGAAGAQGAGQLAWLTDDILNAATRSGGIAVRLK